MSAKKSNHDEEKKLLKVGALLAERKATRKMTALAKCHPEVVLNRNKDQFLEVIQEVQAVERMLEGDGQDHQVSLSQDLVQDRLTVEKERLTEGAVLPHLDQDLQL